MESARKTAKTDHHLPDQPQTTLFETGPRILGSQRGAFVGKYFHCVAIVLYISEGVACCLAVTVELMFDPRI